MAAEPSLTTERKDHAPAEEHVGLASANAGIKKLQKVCLCLENLKS
jgi:hypothetical protein